MTVAASIALLSQSRCTCCCTRCTCCCTRCTCCCTRCTSQTAIDGACHGDWMGGWPTLRRCGNRKGGQGVDLLFFFFFQIFSGVKLYSKEKILAYAYGGMKTSGKAQFLFSGGVYAHIYDSFTQRRKLGGNCQGQLLLNSWKIYMFVIFISIWTISW